MQALQQIPEAALIEKIRNGDMLAFKEVFEQYWEILYKKAYFRLRSQELAEDMVQDVFTDLWAKKENLYIHSGLRNYLYSILKYKIIYWASQQTRAQQLHTHLLQRMEEMEDTILDAMEAGALQKTIAEVIHSFPENMRQIFLLRMQDFTIAEIARALQLAEQTVRNNHTAALKQLRGKLVKEYPHLPIYSLITFLFTKS
ncbi:sigma-70 family RNA polymerase sigma factor [Olivibacter sp. SDN3]|uniref:RNA polymerase sigma factor n=1 Tax=Olivibacter sp. SDN3 TaxID=2764720 RepID=UPI00165198C9|nr:sigma-70 family RNA polymerase sigma factor [Olivibacter sp. SDN3]QNL51048.1 sigma-70 family RNA polymerase sigma factor [Olivibacter sp. SDN3]